MSRAFVKENDGPEPELPAPQRDGPYFVTAEGLETLRAALETARSGGNAREVDDLERKLSSAVVPDAEQRTPGVVAFGSTVTIDVQGAGQQKYRIVGEDEADPMHGTITWQSPLARALLNRRVGDRAVWQRPAGNVAVRIVSVS